MKKLSELVALVQETIDKGATTVEEVHRAIMNQPLHMIEKIAPLQAVTKGVREVQNRTVGSVYDIIRTVNNEVGKIAHDLLKATREPTQATPVEAVRAEAASAKPAPARPAPAEEPAPVGPRRV